MNPTYTSAREIAEQQLKQTSRNFANWQSALELRDRILKAGGNQSSEHHEVLELVKFWSKRWTDEAASIKVSLGDVVITKQLADMKQEMDKVIQESSE